MDKIYLDTSVYGGYFDSEFEIWTTILFDKIQAGKYKVIYSKMTDIELTPAPKKVKDLVLKIPGHLLEVVDNSNNAIELAEQYLAQKVVGKTSRADCLHIALATLHNADILVSWNFKHIVNVNRIRGYNSVNQLNGFKNLEIRTPREILEYED